MPAPRNFASLITNVPGAYVEQRFLPSGSGAVPPNLTVVIGSANGGIPHNAAGMTDEERLNFYSSLTELSDDLRGGPAYYMGEFFLSPTLIAGAGSPDSVGFIRVDPAVRATGAIQDAGTTTDILDLTASRWGALGNRASYRVRAGTNSGYWVSVKFEDSLEERDDVSLPLVNLQYTGAGTAATITISGTTLTTAVTGGPGSEDLNLDLADYPRVKDLLEYLSSLPAASAYAFSAAGSPEESASILDEIAAGDIKTSPVVLSADVEAVLRYINRESGGEIVAELTGARVALETSASYTFLSGGLDGTPDLDDWTAALTLAETLPIRYILAATADPAVHDALKTHLARMSSRGESKFRQGGTGAALGTTDAQQISAALAISSPRVEFCGTPFRRRDSITGEVREFDPFYGAAVVSGIRFGQGRATSWADGKTVNIASLSRSYLKTEEERLIGNGVTVFGRGPNNTVRVVGNVSTYVGPELIQSLPSVLYTADEVSIATRESVADRIEGLDEIGEGTAEAVQQWMNADLFPSFVDRRWLVSNDRTGQAPFTNALFTLEGDVWRIEAEFTLPAPPRFQFITQNFRISGL